MREGEGWGRMGRGAIMTTLWPCLSVTQAHAGQEPSTSTWKHWGDWGEKWRSWERWNTTKVYDPNQSSFLCDLPVSQGTPFFKQGGPQCSSIKQHPRKERGLSFSPFWILTSFKTREFKLCHCMSQCDWWRIKVEHLSFHLICRRRLPAASVLKLYSASFVYLLLFCFQALFLKPIAHCWLFPFDISFWVQK